MTVIQCPICDVTFAPEEEDDSESLLGILGHAPTSLTAAQAKKIEADLGKHLREHSVTDWVRAMAQADAYIEQLENENDELQRENDLLKTRPAPLPEMSAPRGGVSYTPPPLPPQWVDGYESPRERQERMAALRKAGLAPPPPKDTLIAEVRGERPEGFVGRKF